MPEDVFHCPDHGFFEVDAENHESTDAESGETAVDAESGETAVDAERGETTVDAESGDAAVEGRPRCHQCGAAGTCVIAGSRRRRLSTFISGALRHFPDDVGLSLDEGGWTDFDALAEAAVRQYEWASRRAVTAVVDTDPKGRFERHRGRVRAAYGHSVAVDLDAEVTADDSAATGTAGRDCRPPPERLYHGTAPAHVASIEATGLQPMSRQLVHLSPDVETARAVGRRHTDDEPVVFVVDAQGLTENGFAVRKRGRETYTVERVPPRFLDRLDGTAATDPEE